MKQFFNLGLFLFMSHVLSAAETAGKKSILCRSLLEAETDQLGTAVQGLSVRVLNIKESTAWISIENSVFETNRAYLVKREKNIGLPPADVYTYNRDNDDLSFELKIMGIENIDIPISLGIFEITNEQDQAPQNRYNFLCRTEE